MFYLVEFDKRSIPAKHEDADVLSAFIQKNKLDEALALVSGPDDLTFQMSLKEIQELTVKLGGKVTHNDEDKAAEYCWTLIIQSQDDIPTFRPKVAKEILRGGSGSPDTTSPTEPAKSSKRASSKPEPTDKPKPARRNTRLKDDDLLVIGEAPKETTVLFKVWSVVDNSATAMSVQDIIAELELDFEERLLRRYIGKMIRLGYLEVTNA